MKILVALLFCIFSLNAQSEKLIIDAQKFEVSDKKGISSFSGNVKIQMAKDKLEANNVDIYFANNSKSPSKYIASGNVKFQIITDTKHYSGKGEKIEYSPIKQEYTVIGNAFLQEANDNRKIYGDKIYVNQLSGEARVSGSENKPVRFIIDINKGEIIKDKK